MSDLREIQKGVRFLADHGLNLYAVFECASLPPELVEIMLENDIPLLDYARLVLLGHGGRQLWESLQQHGMHTADPVDRYSVYLAQNFIETYLDSAPRQIIYPAMPGVPLIRLGELAGWSSQSPLGLGIHPEYGLWFAYRVAFLTAEALPVTSPLPAQHPCEACEDKPCIHACPAAAVQWRVRFDVESCIDHRVASSSSCADRCLARMACPAGKVHQYDLDQIQYHYLHSLNGFKRYRAQ